QLTGAYNRVYFDKYIERLVLLNKSNDKKTGIIFFDIDHFKSVNDTHGHDIGDKILQAMVQIIKTNIRNSDKLIRWGGEEFILIIPVNSIDEVSKQAEKLRLIIANNEFQTVKNITCSFGVTLHNDLSDIKASVKIADEKLYQAKGQGRNQVIF
ncbi:MAG: diguanylate cyclase (GGDEF)-like protein, partial [Sulfurimonas sp.]